MSQEMLAMRNREPRIMAAICTFSITVREMACHWKREKHQNDRWKQNSYPSVQQDKHSMCSELKSCILTKSRFILATFLSLSMGLLSLISTF